MSLRINISKGLTEDGGVKEMDNANKRLETSVKSFYDWVWGAVSPSHL